MEALFHRDSNPEPEPRDGTGLNKGSLSPLLLKANIQDYFSSISALTYSFTRVELTSSYIRVLPEESFESGVINLFSSTP
jgi:hypothetical protein